MLIVVLIRRTLGSFDKLARLGLGAELGVVHPAQVVRCTVPATAKITQSEVILQTGEVASITAIGRWAIWNDVRQCGPGGGYVVSNSYNSVSGPWPVEGALEGAWLFFATPRWLVTSKMTMTGCLSLAPA